MNWRLSRYLSRSYRLKPRSFPLRNLFWCFEKRTDFSQSGLFRSLSLLFLFTRTNERTNKQTDTNYNTKYLFFLPYLANSFGSTPCASLINTGVVGLAAFNFSYDFRRKFLAPSECLDVWHKWNRNSCTALRPENAFDIIIILCILIIYGGSSLDDWLLLLSSRSKCVLFVVQCVLCDGNLETEWRLCCFRIEKSSDWISRSRKNNSLVTSRALHFSPYLPSPSSS